MYAPLKFGIAPLIRARQDTFSVTSVKKPLHNWNIQKYWKFEDLSGAIFKYHISQCIIFLILSMG